MCCSGCLNLFLLAVSCVQALRFYKRFEVLILPFTTHSSWLFVVNISIVHVQKPGKMLYSLFPFMSFSPRVSLLRHSQKPGKNFPSLFSSLSHQAPNVNAHHALHLTLSKSTSSPIYCMSITVQSSHLAWPHLEHVKRPRLRVAHYIVLRLVGSWGS
jgi:hypothetical protein